MGDFQSGRRHGPRGRHAVREHRRRARGRRGVRPYSAGRLRGADEAFHQDKRGVKGGAEEGDCFGVALATADFDCDGEDDLAVGTPPEDLRSIADAGAVNLLYGSESYGVAGRDDFWSQGSRGIKGIQRRSTTSGWPWRPAISTAPGAGIS